MRASRVIVVLAVMLTGAVVLFFFAPSFTEYSRFQHKSDDYYGKLTRACDTLLAAHPVDKEPFIELSITDLSIPQIIRDLKPLKIKLQPERVWILHGGSIEFGITWERDWSRTNVWTLSTACESHVRVVYIAGK